MVRSDDPTILTGEELALLLTALTPREREICELMALGLDTPAIAKRLFVSLNTIRTQICSAESKLNVHSRAQLVAYWMRGQRTLEALNGKKKAQGRHPTTGEEA